jgi:hypothetical protein
MLSWYFNQNYTKTITIIITRIFTPFHSRIYGGYMGPPPVEDTAETAVGETVVEEVAARAKQGQPCWAGDTGETGASPRCGFSRSTLTDSSQPPI